MRICGLRWALEPFPLHERKARTTWQPRGEPRGEGSYTRTTWLGPKRLWIIIVNIIIIIIIVGWALRACDGARADELSKDYRALRT